MTFIKLLRLFSYNSLSSHFSWWYAGFVPGGFLGRWKRPAPISPEVRPAVCRQPDLAAVVPAEGGTQRFLECRHELDEASLPWTAILQSPPPHGESRVWILQDDEQGRLSHADDELGCHRAVLLWFGHPPINDCGWCTDAIRESRTISWCSRWDSWHVQLCARSSEHSLPGQLSGGVETCRKEDAGEEAQV